MKKTVFYLIIFIESFSAISQLYTPGSGVTDIDGNSYATIIINGQEWIAENLRTTSYANGDPIPNVIDNGQWYILTTGAWAHFNNDSQYDNPYGKLYNWYTVNDSRNVCPTGWHVPSDAEWTVLSDYLGGEIVGGGKMKSFGTQYWESPNTDATNESGFSGHPGSHRNPNGEFDNDFGVRGFWWSSMEFDLSRAWNRLLYSYSGEVGRSYAMKEEGFSVRCLNDQNVGINENKFELKKLVKIVNSLGIESEEKANDLLFFIYSDGSVEKKVIVEK